MASGALSFILNKTRDWKYKNVLKNIKFIDDCLYKKIENSENGVFISSSFDGNFQEMIWHRLKIKSEVPQNGLLKLKIFASDYKGIFVKEIDKKINDLDEFFLDKKISINKKIEVFESIKTKEFKNPKDLLLFDVTGRFLWIYLELVSYEKEQIKIEYLKIEFPRVTFADYLPDIYKESFENNLFLYRFVGIFQSMYVDTEDNIDFITLNFDPKIANYDFLQWISNWLSVKDVPIWGKEKLREILKHVVNLYKIKGTKISISLIVEEFVGTKPIIIEHFEIENNQYYNLQSHIINKLFGDNSFVFTVILTEKYVKNSEKYIEILRVINSVKPIDSICNLVVLNDKIYLDYHCYLEINSYIAKNCELVLDENNDLDVLMLKKFSQDSK
ncbi:MAG: hypothetical protein RsTaC01_0628 [Candidatus Paraimprobicoccus trichonymphae]|uniref:Phage tail protein n=1 Tax=Candidatus Paraimprobicoccus trichonymphae TaxID=3033793 RepID=A0AA48KZY6_9FIRM|nr:MAG: hypothetical protein RsTaC01_0628 [Candidatus Paraimprobicoccus trichonymphae]